MVLVVSALLVLSWDCKVNLQVATIKLLAVLGLKSLGGSSDISKVDVRETLATASIGVGDDADGGRSELLELTGQPVLVNVPGKTTNVKVLGRLAELSSDLRLLDNRGSLSLGLALLGWLLNLRLFLLR